MLYCVQYISYTICSVQGTINIPQYMFVYLLDRIDFRPYRKLIDQYV